MCKEKKFLNFYETVKKIRQNCPWDKEQTHQSLSRYLMEESYETLEAIDQLDQTKDYKHLAEELGDLLLQIFLHAELASEKNAFTIEDVLEKINEKMTRRHPHVFSEKPVENAQAVHKDWDKIKNSEKKNTGKLLDSVPKNLPALLRTTKMIEKVSKVGFQWPNLDGPLAKLEEELDELKYEIKNDSPVEKIEAEFGDLLFSLCNVAHFLKVNPEDSLRKMLVRFEKRFQYVEKELKEQGKTWEESSLEEMDELWNAAKKT